MRPGRSIGFILRLYSCLNLIIALRLPRNTRGFRQLGRIGPHLTFFSALRVHADCGASKSVGVVRKTRCSGALGIFLNVDGELGEFGNGGKNGGFISPRARGVDRSKAGEKGKERIINKPEIVDWVVPLVANTNDVEYSAGVTRIKESTTVVGDQLDGGSPVLGHQGVNGKELFLCAGRGEEEENKCGAGTPAFHNASDKEEADSLTRDFLGEGQVVEEQRRTDSSTPHRQISADDGGSASSYSFSVMKPIGKDVGFLGETATDTSIKSDILRNRAILMQSKVDDLQEYVDRIIQILRTRGLRDNIGLKEDTRPDAIFNDDRQKNAALLALTAAEKECDDILDILLLVLKDDDAAASNGMPIAQKERLLLFQTRLKKFKDEFEVYHTKVSQLGKWEVQTRWMRHDLLNARKDRISAETDIRKLKARRAKEIRTLEAQLAAQQNALEDFKLRTFSVERQSQKDQIGLESELKRYQTWNTLLVEELENLKMKQKQSVKQFDSSSVLRRQKQKLEETADDHHLRHENDDEELILALKAQEQSFKDSSRRKRRLHIKEIQELKDRLQTQRKKHKRVMERMLEQWQRDVVGLKEDARKLKEKYHSSIVASPSEPKLKFRKETQKPEILRLEQTLRCLEMSGI